MHDTEDDDNYDGHCSMVYFNVEPDKCGCALQDCPDMSTTNDPQINEFGTNAVATNDGSYVFIDQYWGYLEVISPDGKDSGYGHTPLVECKSNHGIYDVYRVHSIQYDKSSETLYGIVMVPNELDHKYESKLVTIDTITGECVDVLSPIEGTLEKVPDTCCGNAHGPAFDQKNSVYYSFGARGYSPHPTKNTVVAVEVTAKNYSIGFLPSDIASGSIGSYLAYDDTLGLIALGQAVSSKYTYTVNLLSSWSHFGEVTSSTAATFDLEKDTQIDSMTYDNTAKMLYVFSRGTSIYDGSTSRNIIKVNMTSFAVTSCEMPDTCAEKYFQWPVMIEE